MAAKCSERKLGHDPATTAPIRRCGGDGTDVTLPDFKNFDSLGD